MRPENAAQRVLTMGIVASLLAFSASLAIYALTGSEFLARPVAYVGVGILVSTPPLALVLVLALHVARRERLNALITMAVLTVMALGVTLSLLYGRASP